MPQDDLQSTLGTGHDGGANDRNIACETMADDDPKKNDVIPDEVPPESFWLSKDAEYDWFDRNAFYERKDSTRGNSMNLNPGSNSNSQRFSGNLKSKASIIGLPKSQKATFVGTKRRMCRPANIKMFPKRTESVGKSTTPVEPGSPKVSCMGRVRSKRSRRRSNSLRRSEKAHGVEKQKTGFYSKVMGMFRSKKCHRKPSRSGSRKVVEVLMEKQAVVGSLRKSKSVTVKVREISVSDQPTAEPPGLGGMKRFASVRRSGSWTSEDFNLAVSAELDRRVDRS
ncbi:hypothetical protein PHJA_002296800 [Phtheirospermum japonicum]|uniref:Uncharacterized protein n=1 Tax=Phtheirospermum japonicum TaxID=374723 RepID=A0A830CV89_9LAMI|nr:hypothetical protein PHJA_002296800 [Phtheirospermum japonicum]